MLRDPASVPVTVVTAPGALADLNRTLRSADNVAIDTETPIDGPARGQLRVASIATRDATGHERCFVVDARDLDPARLAPLLSGVVADAWNANFDARVLDAAVWNSSDVTRPLRWWDAQLADALLHQGQSGFNWYHGLAWATDTYLGLSAQGKGTTQLSYTATDDLTAEQVRYAAADAVETLWVADVLRRKIADAGLETICQIEMAARPFLDRMERSGLPFDWPSWNNELDDMRVEHRQVLGRLSDLTGGGQGTLFDQVIEPSWNPASDKQVRAALNRWASQQVSTWTRSRYGRARELTDHDSVTASVLREIGGPVCDALLEFRDHSKTLSTYGESIHEHIDDDGRMRPQYLQVVGTNTGRLASRNPNAQNFTPRMKPHVRPRSAERVFVHGDLSQAELRFLAQVANDQALRGAFERGEDVHVTTAASMFGFDPAKLEISNPDRFKRLRQMAKALNFGIAYGTGAASLARSLTANGTPTTHDEGKDLLAQYRRTYPGTTVWANDRIAEIERVRRRTQRIDWSATMRLARSFSEVNGARRTFRQTNSRWPTVDEVIEMLASMSLRPGIDAVDHVAWVMGFSAPVALESEHDVFTFSSRTVAGRRQQFNLHLDRLFLVATIEAVRSSNPSLLAVRARFERQHEVVLYRRGEPIAEQELGRIFEDRALRRHYIDLVIAEAGEEIAHALLNRAAKERVQATVNAWRNAPIQGGVADIMLDAYARIHQGLWQYPSARPVQTVHDSVVVECDTETARSVADLVKRSLEDASRRFCPDVAPRADVDIRRSLADSDIVDKLS